MKLFETKASDWEYHAIIEINSIEELFEHINKVGNSIIIEQNNWYGEENIEEYWDDLTKEDGREIAKCEYKIIIYDDYVE